MNYRTISAIAACVAGIAAPAFAGQWDEAKAACAEAIAAKAGVEPANYAMKLSKLRDGATKRLTVELRADGEATIIGDCKLRGGEVIEVELKA